VTETSTATRLTIDVFADVVCPWCYIGEKRLERALAERPQLEVTRRWRPFQLQPHLPAGGLPWPDFVRAKFGGFQHANPLFERVATIGAAVGATFDFGRIFNAPNTADAHRLILFAAEAGDEWPLVERLFRAHFAEGRDVGDRETLAELAGAAGLDAEAARRYLAGEQNRDAVTQSQRAAAHLGVSGVPFFVFGGRYAVSGAQPESVLLAAIRRSVGRG
jgi:predicted DsbA family dithiol-disulfide isomerase